MRFNKKPIPSQTYTPTLNGFSLGSGSFTAMYQLNGSIVSFQVKFVLGAGFTFAGSPRFSPPVPIVSGSASGAASFTDVGAPSIIYEGELRNFNTTEITMFAIATAGARGTYITVTSTDPFTFVAGDELTAAGIAVVL